MRAGVCSVQQALTADAANAVKQAINLARRRGHAQVTPLHVASTMLATSTGLLRMACLQAHSHPLQCKALELCFNVALNRLPTSTSSALLGPHSSYPSLSNALVAAFKRAQAHQRRGSIENQQQPILALKIEIEQLLISILDDPSVSRVMREAGFSSTQVKNRAEQAVSLEVCSQSSITVSSKSKESVKPQVLGFSSPHSLPFSHFGIALSKPVVDHTRNDDVVSVFTTLVTKKRNTVITSECLATAENVVRGVMDKFERGDVPGELRTVRFISLPLFSLRHLSKEKIDQKMVELRYTVKSCMSNGVVLYLGDLRWVAEFWSSYGEQKRSYYFSVEHIIMEIKRLVRGFGETGKLWLMGIATFQTYMKCKVSSPSLETIWELYPVTIPVGSLTLSLNLESESQSQSRNKASIYGSSWPLLESDGDNHLPCYTDFSVKFNGESQTIEGSIRNKENTTGIAISTSSSLPLWLQQYKEDARRKNIDDKQEYTSVSELCKKGNSFGGSANKQTHYPEKMIKFASSPPSPISISSHEHNTNLHQTQMSWPVIFEQKDLPKEHRIWISESVNEGYESSLRNVLKPDLLSNPNSSPNSASSSEAMDDMEGLESFKELNDDNLKLLCSSLEKKVPWQKDIIPEIATTVLECRSGMSKRKRKLSDIEEKAETWLFFLGGDFQGKEKIARELARLVFGSQSNFVSIGLSNFSSPRADSTEYKNKRPRDEFGCSYFERFSLALNENPHRVFYVEDVEQIDYCSQMSIKQAIESGKVTLPGGENVPLKDAIIIFSSESFSSVSRASSPTRRLKTGGNKVKDEDGLEEKNHVSLDLNIAIEGDNEDENSGPENGIPESVDKQIIFQNSRTVIEVVGYI